MKFGACRRPPIFETRNPIEILQIEDRRMILRCIETILEGYSIVKFKKIHLTKEESKCMQNQTPWKTKAQAWSKKLVRKQIEVNTSSQNSEASIDVKRIDVELIIKRMKWY